jgi:hypothetical protein
MHLGEPEKRILKRYPKAIAHMRGQHERRRFGLMLGAGASKDLRFPDWKELVHRVAKSPEVEGPTLAAEIKKPHPIIAEVAYHEFRRRNISKVLAISAQMRDVERLLVAQWEQLIKRCLYQDVPKSVKKLSELDTVYSVFLPVIRESPLTINFNYDDTLQRFWLHSRTDEEKKKGRGFETITDPTFQQSHSKSVIYHPNGFLPRNPLERPVGRIIFNDGTFASQMDDLIAGTFSSMVHYLLQQTWLLVGHSLADETLRHLLHKNAALNPGHYHYHIEHCPLPADELTPAMQGQVAANFETYNLITLFLSSSEIAALGRCIAAPDTDISAIAEEVDVSLAYTFYFVGVPAVGKSTCLSYFKSLTTWDEWFEERLPELNKPFIELTDAERTKVDSWILEQVALKNRHLLDTSKRGFTGIHVVDRCVPDAVTFTQPPGWAQKAKALLDAISPGDAHREVHSGHVILLLGDPHDIRIRAWTKNKDAPETYTAGMQRALNLVYGDKGVTKVDVKGMTVHQVVKEVARIIHLREYTKCNLQNRLKLIRDGKIKGKTRIALR